MTENTEALIRRIVREEIKKALDQLADSAEECERGTWYSSGRDVESTALTAVVTAVRQAVRDLGDSLQ